MPGGRFVFERLQDLRRKEISSAVALDEARTDAKIAENAVKEAELNWQVAQAEQKREKGALNQRVVRSPIDGVVTERVLSSGEYRHETNHLMTIAQIDPLNVETYLPIPSMSTSPSAIPRR